ncbi:hypothetical protein PICMEDRAFT_21486, partial [Pichia membranifaciens NRRL Y-2026]
MELIQNLISAPQSATEQEVSDNITTVVDRLAHATLVSDRRGAVLALKSYSRQYREIVIAKGLKQLFSTLHQDSFDLDMVKAIMETLLILFIRGEGDSDLTRSWINSQSRVKNGKYPSPSILIQNLKPDQFSLWIADELTQDLSNLELLIEILEFDDVHTKIYSLQLLQALTSTRPKRTQELFLKSPTAISKLCQVLDDPFEPIRNEAILLLMGIVRGNFNLQKLVVFENAFDRLYRIIDDEGGIQGTIVVQDCLSLITNLLEYNSSNQKYFIETNCFFQLVKLLNQSLSGNSLTWNTQRLDNLITTLETCRLFVVKDTQDIASAQVAIVDSGIMLSCLKLVFSLNIPNQVRVTSLLTVSDVIRSNNDVQFKFSQVDVPYLDPSLPSTAQKFEAIVPITVALLNWCLHVNSVHLFDIRAAALDTLHAFFRDNTEAKIAFIDDQVYTFNSLNGIENNNESFELNDANASVKNDNESLEVSIDPNSLDSKSNIFQTLIQMENYKLNPYKIWFASIILLYVFEDYPEAKLKVMAITLGNENDDEDVISIISAIAQALCTSLKQSDIRVPIAYLMLLCNWCWDNYEAVDEVLKDLSILDQLLAFIVDSANESDLVQGLISYFLSIIYEFSRKTSPISRSQLHQYLSKRIGVHSFSLKIQQFVKDKHVSNFKELDWLNPTRDESGLPEVYFDGIFIDQVSENSQRMTRAIGKDPIVEPARKLDFFAYEEIQQKLESLTREYIQFKLDSTDKSNNQLKEIEKTSKDYSELTTKYEELLSDMESLEIEKDQMLTDLTASVAEVTKLNGLQKTLESQISDLSRNLQESSVKVKNIELENKQLKEKLEVIEKSKVNAENGINKMSRELMNLTKEKATSEKQAKSLEKELSSLKQKFEKEEAKLAAINTQKEKIVIDLENRLKLANANLSKVREEYKKVNETVLANNEKLEKSERNSAELMNKLKTATEIIEKLKNQKDSTNVELNDYKEKMIHEVTTLKSSLATTEEVKENLIMENKKLNEKLESLQEELTTTFEDFTLLQDETSKEIDELNGNITVLSKDIEASEEKNKSLIDENKTLKQQVEKIKDSSASAENQKSAVLSEFAQLREEKENKISELNSQLESLNSELEKLNVANELTAKKLEESESSKTEDVRKLKSSLDNVTKSLSEKTSEFDSLAKANEKDKTRILDLDTELQKTKKSLDNLKSVTSSSISELESNKKVNLSKIQQLESEKKELTDLVSSREKLISNLESELENLKESKNSEIKTLSTLEKMTQQEITRLNAQKKKLEETLADKAKLVDDLKQQAESSEKDLAQKKSVSIDLELNVSKLTRKIEELEDGKKKLSEDNISQTKQLNDLLNDKTEKYEDCQKRNTELVEKLKRMEEQIKEMVPHSKLDEALMLWTEATEKKDKYKEMLIKFNHEIEDSDEDDEDEDED